MSSTLPLPTIAEFRAAFTQGVRADEKLLGDGRGHWSTRSGGGLDVFGGSAAVLWQREGQFTRALFRACTLASATGSGLAVRGLAEFGEAPIEPSYGTGTAMLSRPTAAAGGGTIYTGSRIEVRGATGLLGTYAATADTPVGAAVLSVNVPIRATRQGSGTGAQASSGLRWGEDTIFDTTLVPVVLMCSEGTDQESPAAYLSRMTEDRLDGRVGYQRAIRQACIDVGAAEVTILDANVFGDAADYGVTYIYVADANGASTAALIEACVVALEAVRVAGCDIFVSGMTIVPVSITVTVLIASATSTLDSIRLKADILASVLAEFASRTDFWVFRLATLAGAAMRADPSRIRESTVTSSPAEPTASFTATLARYTLVGTDVSITVTAEA